MIRRMRLPIIVSMLAAAASMPAFCVGPKIVNPMPVSILSGYSEAQKFSSPSGLFIDKKRGDIWVADSGNHQIVEFDAQGNPYFKFRYMAVDPETGEASPGDPISVAVDSSGQVFVTDGVSKRVSMYDYRGRLQKRIDLGKLIASENVQPVYLKTDGSDNLYIADSAGMRLIILDHDQQLLRVLQLKRTDSGSASPSQQQSADSISAMDIGSDGKIYLLNSSDRPCVRVLDSNGKELMAFGDVDAGWDNFIRPFGIVGIDDGTFWVADAGTNIVKQFGSDGKYQQYIGGGPGARPGEMRSPAAVATDGKDRLYVAERGTNRIQIFSLK